jgi:hypothetical protein
MMNSSSQSGSRLVRGTEVDINIRRKKQQKLMVELVERKVRSRAQQLYETRGQGDGHALKDWFQAETEVLAKSALAPLYRRERMTATIEQAAIEAPAPEPNARSSSACEAAV